MSIQRVCLPKAGEPFEVYIQLVYLLQTWKSNLENYDSTVLPWSFSYLLKFNQRV